MIGGPGSESVNPYLLRLISLDSPAADRFRLGHAREVLDAAEAILEETPSIDHSPSRVPFLFYHLERGEDSLAARFRPRFESIVMASASGTDTRTLGFLFEYLVRMEPVSTVEMYVECWKKFAMTEDSPDALGKLLDLPPPRSATILTAILDETEKNLGYYAQRAAGGDQDTRNWIKLAWGREIRRLLAKAEEGSQERMRIEEYLGRGDLPGLQRKMVEEADTLLVEIAARHENPEVRLITKRALLEHPSLRNQKLVEELLNDPDERVRMMAREVKRSHARLAAVPPSQFGHPLAGGKE